MIEGEAGLFDLEAMCARGVARSSASRDTQPDHDEWDGADKSWRGDNACSIFLKGIFLM